jgi:asparagine synthase (glutamine-hydrolysing)
MLQRLKDKISSILRGKASGNTSLDLDSDAKQLILSIKNSGLTYLSERKLKSLFSTCRQIQNSQLPGIFIEAGCALGGSTILISKVKSSGRPLFVYDVFGMIPAPTGKDTEDVHERYKIIAEGKSLGIDGERYYGYLENLFERVQQNLVDFGIDPHTDSVRLIKGLLQQTLHVESPVAFAHIDVDWYEPVMTCLERIIPNLILGGSVVLDDYHDWGGCRKAVDEYFQHSLKHFVLDDSAGSLKVTRIST